MHVICHMNAVEFAARLDRFDVVPVLVEGRVRALSATSATPG